MSDKALRLFVDDAQGKPIHEYFGAQADLLLASAATIIERGDSV